MKRTLIAALYLLVMAPALTAGAPARAQFLIVEKSTFIKYLTTYNVAGTTSNYFRLRIDGLTVAEVVQDKTGGIRKTPIGGGFYIFPEPLVAANVQPFQPGNQNKRVGFINFRIKNPQDARGQLFRPGDEVTFTLALRGGPDAGFPRVPPPRFKTPGGLWRTGDGGVANNSTDGNVKLTGAVANFDPTFTLFNDLDIADYGGPDAAFEVRNLRFINNMPQTAFDAIDLRPVYDESLQSGLPHVDLSSSTATMPSFPEAEHTFSDPFSEPDLGNFVGAYGQIYDLSTGKVVAAFLYGAEAVAVPEPSTWLFLTTGCLGLLGLRWWKQRQGGKNRGRMPMLLGFR